MLLSLSGIFNNVYTQLWRNWHTRMIQVHVRITRVRVQVPSTAQFIVRSGLPGRTNYHQANKKHKETNRKETGMAEEKKNILTYDGLKKLEDELQNLKVFRRREVAQKIKEAREQGDLSENAEYDAARDEQREIENRIAEIEKILKNAVVAEEDSQNTETVNFGCTVTFEDMDSHQSYTYKLVGSTESDILNGRISNESPVGSKLIGSKVGQVITVDTPNGTMNYKVTDFKR